MTIRKQFVLPHTEPWTQVRDSTLPPLTFLQVVMMMMTMMMMMMMMMMMTFLQADDQDRRPSLADLQSEDTDRQGNIL